MDRRQFCRSAFAVGVTTAVYGCSRPLPDATTADTDITAISLAGTEITLSAAMVRELGEGLSGEVLLAGHPQYDSARTIWNGMHDRRPALIARCLTDSDVSQAVSFARDHNVLLAVRGGGHSWPGHSVCDRGLMIDLSQMNRVTVDAGARRARAQGGALLQALDSATLAQGLVTTTGVVSHTGVGGLTLGGGFGRLNRKYGLTIDNVLGATIVTADGRVRSISDGNESDLFWAIRGGGGNFGVVTEFEYQLHPFDRNVLSGSMIWPIAQARDVLEHYAEASPRYSDEMYLGPMLLRVPDLGDALLMEVLYNGDPAQGERELASLRAVGTPAADTVTVQDYMVMQTASDEAFGHGIRSYARNGLFREWTQDLVDTLLDSYDPRVIVANHVAGGAVSRVSEADTAFPHRNAEVMLVFLSGWQDPAQDDEMIAATRAVHSAAAPLAGGYYDNIDFDRTAATGNYGPAYARLSKIKGTYDRANLFRLNSNIEPGTA
jgi:FAD/FMN-containing dehydrogenase